MKPLLTVSAIMLFAFEASALPMVISNGRITYPAGASYTDALGIKRICNSPLVIEQMSNGNMRSSCADKPAITADVYSQMAPAAGGTQKRSDRNLSSDTKTGLRNDRDAIPAQ